MTETRCYGLFYPNGRQAEHPEFGEPHFTTEATATERARTDYADNAQGVPVPRLLDTPCVIVPCAGCETELGDEEEYFTFHFSTREEALKSAEDFGWTIQDGRAWCPGCPPEDNEQNGGVTGEEQTHG